MNFNPQGIRQRNWKAIQFNFHGVSSEFKGYSKDDHEYMIFLKVINKPALKNTDRQL